MDRITPHLNANRQPINLSEDSPISPRVRTKLPINSSNEQLQDIFFGRVYAEFGSNFSGSSKRK